MLGMCWDSVDQRQGIYCGYSCPKVELFKSLEVLWPLST